MEFSAIDKLATKPDPLAGRLFVRRLTVLDGDCLRPGKVWDGGSAVKVKSRLAAGAYVAADPFSQMRLEIAAMTIMLPWKGRFTEGRSSDKAHSLAARCESAVASA